MLPSIHKGNTWFYYKHLFRRLAKQYFIYIFSSCYCWFTFYPFFYVFIESQRTTRNQQRVTRLHTKLSRLCFFHRLGFFSQIFHNQYSVIIILSINYIWSFQKNNLIYLCSEEKIFSEQQVPISIKHIQYYYTYLIYRYITSNSYHTISTSHNHTQLFIYFNIIILFLYYRSGMKQTTLHNRSSYSFTGLFLIVAFIGIWYTAFRVTINNPVHSDSLISNSRIAVAFIAIMFIVAAILFLPDGMIGRPSQKLWKAVTGVALFYTVILTYFIYLTPQETQHVLSNFFDNSLGKPLPEKSYASDCRLYIPSDADPFKNLRDNFFDIFIVAHLIGWFIKTLICRDLKLVLFQSVFFEILEIIFRHWLPNFYECWWDHVILDVVGCNLLGILLGWWVIKKYNLQRLKWSLREGPLKNTFMQNFKQFWLKLDVSNVEYKMFTNTKKYLMVMWFVVFMPLADLCFFFNKFVLNIPPVHYINAIRMWLVALLCINASKQYYAYITKREPQMKINAFLAQLIILLEILLFAKNYQGHFNGKSFPLHAIILMVIFWGIPVLALIKIILSDIYRLIKRLFDSDKISEKTQ